MPSKDIEKRRAQRRQWYANNSEKAKANTAKFKDDKKLWFREFKATLKCSKCPESDPACLDFHHPNEDKEFAVSRMVNNGYSIEKIKLEISKCEVLCANCHRKTHSKGK